MKTLMSACVGAAAALIALASPSFAQNTRAAWTWPFDSDSIWNRPIGANANYQNANFTDASWVGWDPEYHIQVTDSDPYRTVYYPGSWTDRDSGTTVSWLGSMRVPDSLIIADATTNPYSTPNDCSAFLQPDGHSLIQMEPTTRPTAGGNIWGYPQTGQDLYQDGYYGTHYGSGLSAIGGSIRKGELTASGNMRHALKVNVWGQKWLNYANDGTRGYRWPASNADGAASSNYGGTNPKLEMGALLAIPKTVNINNLGLTSNQAKKIAWTLQNYGAYVVDDAGWDAYYFAVEKGVENDWAISTSEVNALFKQLKIVDNNSATSIGGGGSVDTTLIAPPIASSVSNPGFESQQYGTQSPTGWSEWGNGSASYTESYGGAYSGSYKLTHWFNSAYQVYTYQTFSVANGTYTLRARGYRGGTVTACYLEAKNFGGAAKTVNLPTSGWGKIEVTGISVTNGQITVGLWSDAAAGAWANLDHIELLKQ